MNLYCLRCRVKTPTNDFVTVITKSGKRAYSGKCAICNGISFSFLMKIQDEAGGVC